MTISLERIKTLSEIFGIWLTTVGLLVGGGFAVFQYLDVKRENRINATVEYVRAYRTDPIYSIRRRVGISEINASKLVTSALKKSTVENAAQIYNDMIIKRVQEDDLSADLDQLINFYEEVAVCIVNKICDKESAASYFFKQGRDFYRTYYPYICMERDKWHDLSTGRLLQTFFNPSVDKDPCASIE